MIATGRGFASRPEASLESRLVLGALAGLVGTAAMAVAMRALHRRLPSRQRYPLPPREINLGGAVGGCGASDHRGTSPDPEHGGSLRLWRGNRRPVRRGAPGGNPGLGALYGVLVWAASYLGWIPAMRILRPATQAPRPAQQSDDRVPSGLGSNDGGHPARAATSQFRDLRGRGRPGRCPEFHSAKNPFGTRPEAIIPHAGFRRNRDRRQQDSIPRGRRRVAARNHTTALSLPPRPSPS
jgi:hypothetical protein